MTETHTPETITDLGAPKPDPTHIVEVYLQADALITGCRTERYFYGSERAAEGAYALVLDHLHDAVKRDDNGGLKTLEVRDLYGKGTMIVRDLRGVRLLNSASLDDWAIERDARIAKARHTSVVEEA